MLIQNAIKKIISLQDLDTAEMKAVMQQIMTKQATHSQIAGFLVALEMKSPTVNEVTAAVEVIREHAHKILIKARPLIDIVGTGGDGLQTFNISTACSFVVAAAGATVAKHGNRSVSSSCGSADLLEKAGVKLNLNPQQAKACIEEIGIGFLFAPYYHEAAKYASIPRKEIGVRTFFNILGPLTNPAQASHIMLGVYDKKWLMLVSKVLMNLNCQRALTIHSHDGLDEISIAQPTDVVELRNGELFSYEINPKQFGFHYKTLDNLQVKGPEESLALIKEVLNNTPSPARDIVLLNSGAAIYLAGLANNIEDGIRKAREIISSGKAKLKFEQLITYTQQF